MDITDIKAHLADRDNIWMSHMTVGECKALVAEVERLEQQLQRSNNEIVQLRQVAEAAIKLKTDYKQLRGALDRAGDMIDRHGGDASFIVEALKDST